MRCLSCVSLLAFGCQAGGEWGDTFYLCADDGECPPGYVCGHDDHCVIASTGPDAAAGPDTRPLTIDAVPRPPDASPGLLDSGTLVTASFGERPGTMFQDVTMDTFLVESEPGQNNGAHVDLHLAYGGEASQVALVRFDLAALPAGATVVAAELRLFSDADPEGTFDAGSRITLARVLEQWQEGMGNFADGVASWNERLSGVPWTTPGCGAPGSREGTVLAEAALPEVATEYVIPVPSGVVQAWVDDWTTNHGLAIYVAGTGSSDYGWVISREWEPSSMRPLFVVTYVAP